MLGYSGDVYSDEPFQLAWDNGFQQKAPPAGSRLFRRQAGLEAGEGTAEEAADRLLPGIERAYPGSTSARNGKFARFHWPTHPWTKGSYS